MTQNHRVSIIKMVLFTALPSYVMAEVFFGFLYFSVIQAVYYIQYLLSISSTAQVEANMQIFAPTNIVIFIIGMSLMSLIMCLEMMTIISITMYDYYRDDHIPLWDLICFAFSRMKTFLHWRSIPFFVFLFFFPKAQYIPETLLMLNIPPFITEELFKTPLYMIGILLVLAVGMYLVYRSIFVLHFVFLERNTFTKAFSKSFTLTRKIGIRRLFSVFMQSLFAMMIFVLPVIAFGIAFSRIIVSLESTFGNSVWVLSNFVSDVSNFLLAGLSGVFFLAALTVTYIRSVGYQESIFAKRFHFLEHRPEFTPRWKNVRALFSHKIFAIFTVLGILLMPLFALFIFQWPPVQIVRPLVISHRWVSIGNFIENTTAGIVQAKKQNADMVEIDVYQSKDGTLFLSHDDSYERVAGVKWKIKDLTSADIKNIRLPNGEHIPTLKEVLEIAKKDHIRLLIEPKIHGHEQRLPETLITLLRKEDMVGQVQIHSFNLDLLKNIKKQEPHLQVGLIVFGGFGRFGLMDVDFFSLQERVVTASVVNNIHQFEKKVYIWTVNDPDKLAYYVRTGVDGIITDEVPTIDYKLSELKKLYDGHPRVIFRIFGTDFYPDDFFDLFRKNPSSN